MITIFNRKEIYMGQSMKRFSEMKELLVAKNILYKYRVVNNDDGRNRLGASELEFRHTYYLYVHKKDFVFVSYLQNN